MADLFTLDAVTLATVEQGIDSLIHQLGKQCQIFYEPDATVCPNCRHDYATNKSANIYNNTGPKPFQFGKCPVCKGTGYVPASGVNVDVVQLLIDWQPKPWLFINPKDDQMRIPQGLVQTKGFLADMPKIIQAKYIIVDYTNAGLTQNRFVRWGEVILTGNIVKSKFFVCFWERYGD